MPKHPLLPAASLGLSVHPHRSWNGWSAYGRVPQKMPPATAPQPQRLSHQMQHLVKPQSPGKRRENKGLVYVSVLNLLIFSWKLEVTKEIIQGLDL